MTPRAAEERRSSVNSLSNGLDDKDSFDSGFGVMGGCFMEATLGVLRAAPTSQRGAACARGRLRIRAAISQLDVVLKETEEALKLRPSKKDKLTAANYHSCYRHLHWALDRCQQMQQVAKALENYDGNRLADPKVSTEYALLGVDIVARHDRAYGLLQSLCKENEEMDAESTTPRLNAFTEWLVGTIAVCSGRACVNDAAWASAGDAKLRNLPT